MRISPRYSDETFPKAAARPENLPGAAADAGRLAMVSNHQGVLSVGADPQLLELRHQVLESAGLKVFTTYSESVAISRMREGGCQTLVVCHTLKEDARRRLIQNYRQYCPAGRIIGISIVPGESSDDLDIVVRATEVPDALIDAIPSASSSH